MTAIPAGIPASQGLRDTSPCLGSSRGPGCGHGAGLAPTLSQESLCFPVLRGFPVTAVSLPQIRLRCQKGIPPSLRGRAWQYLSGSKVKLEQNMGKFDVSPAGDPPAPPDRGRCWGGSCSPLDVCWDLRHLGGMSRVLLTTVFPSPGTGPPHRRSKVAGCD